MGQEPWIVRFQDAWSSRNAKNKQKSPQLDRFDLWLQKPSRVGSKLWQFVPLQDIWAWYFFDWGDGTVDKRCTDNHKWIWADSLSTIHKTPSSESVVVWVEPSLGQTGPDKEKFQKSQKSLTSRWGTLCCLWRRSLVLQYWGCQSFRLLCLKTQSNL